MARCTAAASSSFTSRSEIMTEPTARGTGALHVFFCQSHSSAPTDTANDTPNENAASATRRIKPSSWRVAMYVSRTRALFAPTKIWPRWAQEPFTCVVGFFLTAAFCRTPLVRACPALPACSALPSMCVRAALRVAWPVRIRACGFASLLPSQRCASSHARTHPCGRQERVQAKVQRVGLSRGARPACVARGRGADPRPFPSLAVEPIENQCDFFCSCRRRAWGRD